MTHLDGYTNAKVLHSGPARLPQLPGALIRAVTVNVLLVVALLAVVVAAPLLDVAVVVIILLARMIAVTVTTIAETAVTALAAQMIGKDPRPSYRIQILIMQGS